MHSLFSKLLINFSKYLIYKSTQLVSHQCLARFWSNNNVALLQYYVIMAYAYPIIIVPEAYFRDSQADFSHHQGTVRW